MNEGVPTAALLRENEWLRNVVAAAIRLRALGMQADELDASLKAIWDANPDMPRSATQQIMVQMAWDTALKRFDDVVMEAAAAGMDWAVDHGQRGPKSVMSAAKEGE